MYCILIGCLVTALLVSAEKYQYSTETGQYQQQLPRSQQPEHEHHILADPNIVDSYSKSYKETFGELNVGRDFFEGDIMLTKQQSDFITRRMADDSNLEPRAIVKDVRKLWPKREVPYVISDDLRDQSKEYVKSAVKEWKSETCVNLRPKTDSDTDYIEFVYDGGCSSYVGKIGGKQTISVGSDDGSVTCKHGNIVHELAHSLGYFHEHSRPDRDDYITVMWDNVMDGYQKNFRKESDLTIDSRGEPYDYDSVMHYGAFFFTNSEGVKTIQTKDKGASIGQRVGLSDLDIKQARLLYNCDGDFDDTRSNTDYYDPMKRTHVKKHKQEQKHSSSTKDNSAEKKSAHKAAHLKKAVKHYVEKINKKSKKAFGKTKITSVKKNNMEDKVEGYDTIANDQQALQSQDTQQALLSQIATQKALQSQDTQQALQSQIATQKALQSQNTQQATVVENSQQALVPAVTQQALQSENTQQAAGASISDEGAKPDVMVTDEDLGEENLGMNYFEGDMILTDDQRQYLEGLKDDKSETAKRALIKNTTFLWPDRTVYYKFDDSVDEIGQKNAEDALKHWQEKTCLKFKKRNDEKDYINFVFEGGCASRVGRGGGMQKLTIGSTELRCKKGNIIHEVGHALGFFHEHSRPDRDDYVEVLSKNIMSGYERNFWKFSSKLIDSRNVPYDYGSIMQYGRAFFSKLSPLLPTMVTKKKTADGQEVEIGQRLALSDMDIMQANLLYGCDGRKRLTDEEREKLEEEYSDPMTGPCGDTYDINACSTIRSLGYCEKYPRTLRRACGQTCQLCSTHPSYKLSSKRRKSIISRLRLDKPRDKSQ